MEHYKTVTIPAVPEKTVKEWVKTTCDMCKDDIHRPVAYDIEEIEVSLKVGTNYPEGGSGELIEIDICSKCFTGKLVPFIKSQGAEVKTKKWEW